MHTFIEPLIIYAIFFSKFKNNMNSLALKKKSFIAIQNVYNASVQLENCRFVQATHVE